MKDGGLMGLVRGEVHVFGETSTQFVGPAPDLLAMMEATWQAVNAHGSRPDYILLPMRRHAVRRRGKTMVFYGYPAWVGEFRRIAARSAIDLSASDAVRLKASGLLA